MLNMAQHAEPYPIATRFHQPASTHRDARLSTLEFSSTGDMYEEQGKVE